MWLIEVKTNFVLENQINGKELKEAGENMNIVNNEFLIIIFEKLLFDFKQMLLFLNRKHYIQKYSKKGSVWEEYKKIIKLPEDKVRAVRKELKKIVIVLETFICNVDVNPDVKVIDKEIKKYKKMLPEFEANYIQLRFEIFFKAIKIRKGSLKNGR